METNKTKSYSGRVYETKDSFAIESVISKATKTSLKEVRIEDVSDFINSEIKQFNNKKVNIEVSIKITEI
jgi:hypothetical protein